MSEKLEICPFCGGKPIVGHWNDDERNGYAEHWQVSCSVCDARAPGSTYRPFGRSMGNHLSPIDARQAAADNWNRRHQEQETTSEFERLLSK